MSLLAISDALTADLDKLRFASPVTHVYNPLGYARTPHRTYLERYGQGPKEVLLVGMNPGPWGMAQTGVPFGAVPAVRDWLKIDGWTLDDVPNAHPKRPITGLACGRQEVSGQRVWGWAQETFGTPERFFEQFFIGNYLPLIFLETSGRNRTPDKLPAAERKAILAPCDRALRRLTEALAPRLVVGVGVWAEQRARAALDGLDIPIGRILHPSPASPIANRGWAPQATQQLRDLGVDLP